MLLIYVRVYCIAIGNPEKIKALFLLDECATAAIPNVVFVRLRRKEKV